MAAVIVSIGRKLSSVHSHRKSFHVAITVMIVTTASCGGDVIHPADETAQMGHVATTAYPHTGMRHALYHR